MPSISGVLKNKEIYQPKRPPRLTEAALEGQLLNHAATIFPNWHILPFKILVYSEIIGLSARPDLVFIHKEYKNWCVIEVETSNHGLDNHIIPQIKIFQDGKYDKTHVDYLLSAKKCNFDSLLLDRLICNIQPEIFVISENYNHEWHNILNTEGSKFFAFEPHENSNAQWCFHYKGDIPSVEKVLLTFCSTSKNYSLIRCLQLEKVDALKKQHNDEIEIILNGEIIKWKIFITENTGFIVPINNIQIDFSKSKWAIFFDDGFLILEQINIR